MKYTDSYSTSPGLDFDDYAVALSNTASNSIQSKEGALVIGILGRWGCGKTTLMRCIEKQFYFSNGTDSKNKAIWFNAWKYDSKESIANALIQSILIEIRSSEHLNPKAKELCKTLSEAIRIHAFEISKEILLGFAKKQINEKSGLDIDKISSDSSIQSLEKKYKLINDFEEDFKQVIDSYVGKEGKLAIFIDDLDRCLPENALDVLESLKLYLDKANCVFFIGIDNRTIERAVRLRYPDSEITGKEYMEKMIQLNFFVPSFPGNKIVPLLQNEMSSIANKIEKSHWRLIILAADSNLRKIKQYLISWELIESLMLGKQRSEKDKMITSILLLIRMNLPELYSLIKNQSYTFLVSAYTAINFDERGNTNERNSLIASVPRLKEIILNDSNRPFLDNLAKSEFSKCTPDELKRADSFILFDSPVQDSQV